MATVTLSVVGGVIGGLTPLGPVGAVLGAGIGGAIGGYIDQRYVLPALFPPQDILGGRLTEFNLGEGSEGAPINYCIGQEIRVPGVVIWRSEIREVTRKEDVGKGGEQSIKSFKYFVDLAVAFSNNQVSKVLKVIADGKQIYQDQSTFSKFNLVVSTKKIIQFNNELRSSSRVLDSARFFLDFTTTKASADFTELRSGEDVTISGYASPGQGNNRTAKVVFTRDNEDGTATFRIEGDNALTELNSISGINVSQVTPRFDKAKLSGIQIYLGTSSQNVSPTLEAALGVGNAPAYRNTGYFVITDLAIEFYGNRIPNFNVVVEENPTKTVQSAIVNILERNGLQSSDYDVSAVGTQKILRGYAIAGAKSAIRSLEPILIAYNLSVTESNAKIVFKPREGQTPSTIDSKYLSAADSTEENRIRKIQFAPIDSLLLPEAVTINYVDIDKDNQRGSRSVRRQRAPSKEAKLFDLPLVLDRQEATDIAGRLLFQAYRNQEQVSFSVAPRFVEIEEGDYVKVSSYGQQFTIFVGEVSRGSNGVLEIKGFVEEATSFVGKADPTSKKKRKIGVPSTVDLELFSVAPLRDEDIGVVGIYYGLGNYDGGERFRGAEVFTSFNDTNYKSIGAVLRETTVGQVVLSVSQTEVVIDNEEVAAAFPIGIWELSASGNDPYLGKSSSSTIAGNTFRFEKVLPSAGTYQVFVRYTAAVNRTAIAKYDIYTDAGVVSKVVNQSDPFTADQWVSLGAYAFTSVGKIILTAQETGPSTNADAVRFFKEDTTNRLKSASPYYWDRVNSISVRLYGGALESRSEDEVLSGSNIAIVGGEVIGFQTATLTGTSTYTLSNLLRGQRGTEDKVDNHLTGERFVLIERGSVNFIPLDKNDLGSNRYIKAVAPGEIEANISGIKVFISGENTKPLAPYLYTSEKIISTVLGPVYRLRYMRRKREQIDILKDPRIATLVEEDLEFPPIPEGRYIVRVKKNDGTLLREYVTSGKNKAIGGVNKNPLDEVVVTILASELQSLGVANGQNFTVETSESDVSFGESVPAKTSITLEI